MGINSRYRELDLLFWRKRGATKEEVCTVDHLRKVSDFFPRFGEHFSKTLGSQKRRGGSLPNGGGPNSGGGGGPLCVRRSTFCDKTPGGGEGGEPLAFGKEEIKGL